MKYADLIDPQEVGKSFAVEIRCFARRIAVRFLSHA
jgi:hypothetical protein